ncbi:hypothetical protein BS47DRAFT_1369637 [Hydnum rufescens UP504]|uniref:Uncharacterized protein n=1 Tax=Hydnum rufescens UP504 TaxID=1448309 RepID=A0A9P6ACX5_9AGAM|nr:hypothetical protein BS47DRAFT_1369637 [Hydnum rufescens UP504]
MPFTEDTSEDSGSEEGEAGIPRFPGRPMGRNALRLTLGNFVEGCARLMLIPEDETDEAAVLRNTYLARAVLEGITPSGNLMTIDFSSSILQNHEGIRLERDQDSLIAHSRNLPYECDLTIFVIPRECDSLQKPVHITASFNYRELSTIPNCAFAQFSAYHGLVRVAFPRLAAMDGAASEKFYDDILRPAFRDVFPPSAVEWMPTYSSEVFRTTYRNNRVVPGSRLWPSALVPALGRKIIEIADTFEWSKDLFFVHSMRGARLATVHNPSDPVDRQIALQDFMTPFDPQQLSPADEMWVDIGFNFHLPGVCLQPRTSQHADMVSRILGVTAEDARVLTRLQAGNRGAYHQDINAAFPQLSGFGVVPGDISPRIKYLQVYTTDKHVTAHLEKGHTAKWVEPQDVLFQSPDATKEDFFSQMIALCSQSACEGIDGKLRVEVRVPYADSDQALLHLTREFPANFCCAIPTRDWWYGKMVRYVGIRYCALRIIQASPRLQARESVLTLLVFLCYLANSLINRPKHGQHEHKLLRASLPITPNRLAAGLVDGRGGDPYSGDIDSDEDDLPQLPPSQDRHLRPYLDHGMFVSRPLKFTPNRLNAPRFDESEYRPGLDPRSLAYFFKMGHDQLIQKLGAIKLPVADAQHPTRQSRNNRTLRLLERDPDDNPAGDPLQFDLERLGFRIPEAPVDDEDDLHPEERIIPNPEEQHLDEYLLTLFRSMMAQLHRKIPTANNRQFDIENYHRPLISEDEVADESIYRKLDLGEVWETCQIRISALQDLWDSAFFHLVLKETSEFRRNPSTGRADTKHYSTCTYYTQFYALISRLRGPNHDTAVAIRREFKSRIDTFTWLPWATKEGIWSTGSYNGRNGKRIMLPPGRSDRLRAQNTTPCAPVIVVNPRFARNITWSGARILLDQSSDSPVSGSLESGNEQHHPPTPPRTLHTPLNYQRTGSLAEAMQPLVECLRASLIRCREELSVLETAAKATEAPHPIWNCGTSLDSVAHAVWEMERRVVFFTTQIMVCEGFMAQVVGNDGPVAPENE